MNGKKERGQYYLLIGSYTWQGHDQGIHVFSFDNQNGTTSYIGSATVENPSYLVLNHTQDRIYAVTESGEAPSFVNTVDFDPITGTVKPLNRNETDQKGLCNIEVSPDGGYILTANYGSGSVSVFKVGKNELAGAQIQQITFRGAGPVAGRQEASHIHCVRFSPDRKYIFVTDLGNDCLYRYKVCPGMPQYLDESSLEIFKTRPGSGPRHFVFFPDGKYMYLANELTSSVTVFMYNNGEISEIQHIPASRTGNGDGADIKVSPDGRYVYMSIRENGDDGVAIYSRDLNTGLISNIGYQQTVEHPRNIEFSPGGDFLLVAGMKADTVQVFRCMSDGMLQDTGHVIRIAAPTCLVFTNNH